MARKITCKILPETIAHLSEKRRTQPGVKEEHGMATVTNVVAHETSSKVSDLENTTPCPRCILGRTTHQIEPFFRY